jgi:C1A family cysteine protease
MKTHRTFAKSRLRRIYNWRPDLPDKRDYYYTPLARLLPEVVDLRPHLSHIEDQGNLGSCTANAWVATIEYLDKLADGRYRSASRLYLYYNERILLGTVDEDSGANIRDGAKAIAKWGTCAEQRWPYKINKFRTKPSFGCYREGATHKAVSYHRVDQTEQAVMTAISDGLPVVFGFTVYESFESAVVAKSGVVPMPKPGEAVLGGHAVTIVGYEHTRRQFIVRNSWGTAWGRQGYCYMPFDYVLDGDLAEDFWVLQQVENVKLKPLA